MIKVRLGDVATINPRISERPTSEALVSFIAMADVDARTGVTTRGEDRPFGEVSKGYTHFRNEDILVAKITPCFENGKIAQACLRHSYGSGSTEFHVIRPDVNQLNARYLLHFL